MHISQKTAKHLYDRFVEVVKKWPSFVSINKSLKEANISFWVYTAKDQSKHVRFRVDSNFVPAMDSQCNMDWVRGTITIPIDNDYSNAIKIKTLIRADDAAYLRGKVLDYFTSRDCNAAKDEFYLISMVCQRQGYCDE